jgi:hypothetical protein
MFRSKSAFVLVCIAAICSSEFHAQNCVYQSTDGHPYKWKRIFHPQSGLAQGPVLKIVAFGDSVVWSDGDKSKHKIVWLVSQNVANVTGQVVELDSYAHSGAALGSSTGNEQSNLPVHNRAQLGDLDAQAPTTWQQAQCATREDSNADYVLMDGCINEVGATNIALPPVFTHVTPETIRKSVFNNCAANMRDALEFVETTFQKAKRIVLLNYFLVVSQDSIPKPLVEEQAQTPHEETRQQKQQENKLEQAVKKTSKHAPVAADRNPSAAEVKQQVQTWQSNSYEFLHDTTSCFSWAIASATAGGQDAPNPEPDPSKAVCIPFHPAQGAAEREPSIALAAISDNPEFTYGAANTHLWLLPLLFYPHDEMYWARALECTLHPFRGDKSCYINPLAHPNPTGTQCYSETIVKELGMPWNPPEGTPKVKCE